MSPLTTHVEVFTPVKVTPSVERKNAGVLQVKPTARLSPTPVSATAYSQPEYPALPSLSQVLPPFVVLRLVPPCPDTQQVLASLQSRPARKPTLSAIELVAQAFPPSVVLARVAGT